MADGPPERHDRRVEMEQLFLTALSDIERVIRFVARRHRLSRSEEEEFSSEVKLALVEDDYRILSLFRGRSSLRTYLTTVIQRLFLDHRQRMWGKWRPSAEAQRRGALACRLEALLFRDGLSFDEAVETLHTNFRITETRTDLADLASALPARAPRRTIGDEALSMIPADGSTNPEIDLEGRAIVQRTQEALRESFETLSGQDRLILRFRFEDGLSVADIARALKEDQTQLYRRIERLLRSLRQALEAQGLAWPVVLGVIEKGQCHLRLPKVESERGLTPPSNPEGTS